MNNFKRAALLAALTTVSFSAAQAANDEGDAYIDGLVTGVKMDRDRLQDDGFAGFSGRLGKAYDRWNLELAASGLDIDGDTAKGGADLDQFSLGGNALAVFHRGGVFQPYLLAGLGGVNSKVNNNTGGRNLYYDLGAGAIIPIFNKSGRLRAEIVRRHEDNSLNSDDWMLNIGFGVPFGKKAAPIVAAAAAAPVFLDSDGDGVENAKDRCPNSNKGAAVDANGCELDSDGDGVVDFNDDCPNTAAGTEVDTRGCPIVTVINLEGVNFRTNSAELVSNAASLLDVQAAKLVANPDVIIEVAGHTDADGAADYNQRLSQKRAEAVRDYLISKNVGASRITARGYGESQPIANNNTADGKAANRRVELRIQDK